MNRIFNPQTCPCRRARLHRRRIMRLVESIEHAAGNAIDFFIPSRKSFLDDPRQPVTFYLKQYETEVPQETLASSTAAELRNMAATLVLAAEGIERLEGGAA